MKGIICAGGKGTRLGQLTKAVPKHLLGVYDRPMCCWPIKSLVDIGVTDICLVTDFEMAGHYIEYLGDGSRFGCHLMYAVQETPGGIPHAILQAESFVRNEPFVVILGDNAFRDSEPLAKATRFTATNCTVVTINVDDPSAFGVCVTDAAGEIVDFVEKPKDYVGNAAVVGFYSLPADAMSKIKKLKPSARGELEIMDLVRYYLSNGRARRVHIADPESWVDLGGSCDGLLGAQIRIRGWDAATCH